MTTIVQKIADEVRSLPRAQLEEFLAWLADYELQHSDEWDKEMELVRKNPKELRDVFTGEPIDDETAQKIKDGEIFPKEGKDEA